MSVYFITCRDLNMVKIGYASWVPSRLAGIRVACPLPIELELVLPGYEAEEKALHAQLKEHRVRGEWFRITPEIERMIENPPKRESGYEELRPRQLSELNAHELLERAEAQNWLRRRKANLRRDEQEARRRELIRELNKLEDVA